MEVSQTKKWFFSLKWKCVGRDEHMRFSWAHLNSRRTHNHVTEKNWRQRKGQQQAPDVPDSSRTVHAALSNNCWTLHWSDKTHTVHTVSTKTTHSWKKSDVTEAMLKTSPVVTKQLHSPARVSLQNDRKIEKKRGKHDKREKHERTDERIETWKKSGEKQWEKGKSRKKRVN